MILLLDNYDSFVHNLARYLRRLDQEVCVERNDALTVGQIERLEPAAIVLSPGPCTPLEAGVSLELVRQLAGKVPMLGVCLGHQTIAAAFGARILQADRPVHGRTSTLIHFGASLFTGLASPLAACRYHSLVVDPRTLPAEFEVTATTRRGTIMAIAHRTAPLWGVQFHPESILTEGGYRMLANFLRLAGLRTPGVLPQRDDELPRPTAGQALPLGPVTF